MLNKNTPSFTLPPFALLGHVVILLYLLRNLGFYSVLVVASILILLSVKLKIQIQLFLLSFVRSHFVGSYYYTLVTNTSIPLQCFMANMS